jgi:hypothetical protein
MCLRFQDVAPSANETYPEGVIESLQKVGDRIGGHVKLNFDLGIKDIRDHPDQYPTHPAGFTNACATRMSYVLNYCGVHIAKSSLWQTVTGADNNNYIYRVEGIRAFLLHTFGDADIVKGPTARIEDFQGKKGIMVFDLNFSDASGHATLWNGRNAVDEDYFHPRPGLSLGAVRLWLCA